MNTSSKEKLINNPSIDFYAYLDQSDDDETLDADANTIYIKHPIKPPSTSTNNCIVM